MKDAEIRFYQLFTALQENNYRMTPQRVELIRLIAASEGHPSAAQLFAEIKAIFPTISHATVYKTLALLKEINQVLEIDLRNDSHYDGRRPEPHPHLICTRCNKIMDAELEIAASSINKLEETTGFKILQQQINFYGLCGECSRLDD